MYPGDSRPSGSRKLAPVVQAAPPRDGGEQAGRPAASRRAAGTILRAVPTELHPKTPLVIGSKWTSASPTEVPVRGRPACQVTVKDQKARYDALLWKRPNPGDSI